jgi:hypothetical protein
MAKKYKKKEVDFESPAKGKRHCGDCIYFKHPNCQIVEGDVSSDDWCNRYQKDVCPILYKE